MKIPPYLMIDNNMLADRRIKKLCAELPNGQGLGLFIGLKFTLLASPNQRCYLSDIDEVAYDLRTSAPLLLTIIGKYNLFSIEEDNNGEQYFCPMLDKALLPYYEKCRINSENAKKGVEKKRLKKELQLKELRDKLSCNDSSKQSQNKRSTNINNIVNEDNHEELSESLLNKQLLKDKRKRRDIQLASQNIEVVEI